MSYGLGSDNRLNRRVVAHVHFRQNRKGVGFVRQRQNPIIGTAREWENESRAWLIFPSPCRVLVFPADGKRLLALAKGSNFTPKLWDTVSGEAIPCLMSTRKPPAFSGRRQIAFCDRPIGRVALICKSSDASIRKELKPGIYLRKYVFPLLGKVPGFDNGSAWFNNREQGIGSPFATSPDGKLLAVPGSGGISLSDDWRPTAKSPPQRIFRQHPRT